MEIKDMTDTKVLGQMLKACQLPGETLADLMEQKKLLTEEDKAELVANARAYPDQIGK